MTQTAVRLFVNKLWETKNHYDPRLELDRYFWSAKHYTNHYEDVETWCNESLGNDNWFRMFDKFWFTSESECVMFRLVWMTGVNDGRRDQLQA